VIVAAVSLFAFWLAWRGDPARLPHARAVTFCVAAFSQLLFAIGCRSDHRTAIEIGFFSNPWLLAAIAVSALLQVSVVTLPYAQDVFQVRGQLGSDWAWVAGLSLVPVTVIELGKLAWRLTSTRRP